MPSHPSIPGQHPSSRASSLGETPGPLPPPRSPQAPCSWSPSPGRPRLRLTFGHRGQWHRAPFPSRWGRGKAFCRRVEAPVSPSPGLAWRRGVPYLPLHVLTSHSLDVNRHSDTESAGDGLIVGQSLWKGPGEPLLLIEKHPPLIRTLGVSFIRMKVRRAKSQVWT